MIASMIAGAIIGLLAGAITQRGNQRGCLGNIILGLAGAWIGQLLFGYWGPQMAGMAVVPSLLGSILLLAIFGRRDF